MMRLWFNTQDTIPRLSLGETYELNEELPALETAEENGLVRYGPVTLLPAGAQVVVWAVGYSERTIKVSWEGSLYFIFRHDLEPKQARQMRH